MDLGLKDCLPQESFQRLEVTGLCCDCRTWMWVRGRLGKTSFPFLFSEKVLSLPLPLSAFHLLWQNICNTKYTILITYKRMVQRSHCCITITTVSRTFSSSPALSINCSVLFPRQSPALAPTLLLSVSMDPTIPGIPM